MTEAEKKIARASKKDTCPCDADTGLPSSSSEATLGEYTEATRKTPATLGEPCVPLSGSTCVKDTELPTDEEVFEVDMDQVEALYTFFNTSIRASLQADYDCKKINGTTFSDLWSKMIPSIMQSSLSAVVSIQTKETLLDKKLKELQICEMQQDSLRKDMIANSEIRLKETQANEIVADSGRQSDVTKADVNLKTHQVASVDADTKLKGTQSNEITKESSRKSKTVQADVNLKNAQVDLACQQKAKVKYETDSILPSQYDLTVRQKDGFDDNLRQKLFEAQMNAWAMMFSSGLLVDVPCFIDSDQATKLYNAIIRHEMPGQSATGCGKATT